MHRPFIARGDRQRYRSIAAEPQGLQRSFHQLAAEPASLVSRNGANLCRVPDSRGDAGIQDNSGEMACMRRPKNKRRIGLKLSTAGKDDDVFQETQSA